MERELGCNSPSLRVFFSRECIVFFWRPSFLVGQAVGRSSSFYWVLIEECLFDVLVVMLNVQHACGGFSFSPGLNFRLFNNRFIDLHQFARSSFTCIIACCSNGYGRAVGTSPLPAPSRLNVLRTSLSIFSPSVKVIVWGHASS